MGWNALDVLVDGWMWLMWAFTALLVLVHIVGPAIEKVIRARRGGAARTGG